MDFYPNTIEETLDWTAERLEDSNNADHSFGFVIDSKESSTSTFDPSIVLNTTYSHMDQNDMNSTKSGSMEHNGMNLDDYTAGIEELDSGNSGPANVVFDNNDVNMSSTTMFDNASSDDYNVLSGYFVPSLDGPGVAGDDTAQQFTAPNRKLSDHQSLPFTRGSRARGSLAVNQTSNFTSAQNSAIFSSLAYNIARSPSLLYEKLGFPQWPQEAVRPVVGEQRSEWDHLPTWEPLLADDDPFMGSQYLPQHQVPTSQYPFSNTSVYHEYVSTVSLHDVTDPLSNSTTFTSEAFQNGSSSTIEYDDQRHASTSVETPSNGHSQPAALPGVATTSGMTRTDILPRSSKMPKREKKINFLCKVEGCEVTCRRRTDMVRHHCTTHAREGVGALTCPLVDCIKGAGHEIPRKDKVRAHLATRRAVSSDWKCIIRGCNKTAAGRDGIVDHIGKHHDCATRTGERELLVTYGLVVGDSYCRETGYKHGYLMRTNICSHKGCPFGTESAEDLEVHIRQLHQGALCPCPIPTCQQIFDHWLPLSRHLASSHNTSQRHRAAPKLLEQGFWPGNVIYHCPICEMDVTMLVGKTDGIPYSFNDNVNPPGIRVRKHLEWCLPYDQLKVAAPEILKAWRLSCEDRHMLNFPGAYILHQRFTHDDDRKLLAYLTWPEDDFKAYNNDDDFEEFSAEVERKAIAQALGPEYDSVP